MTRQSIEQINNRPKRTTTTINIAAFKALLQAIALRPRTRPELMELTGLTNSTISRWVAILRSRNGKDNLIYVYDYIRPSGRGCWIERFLLGYGMPDAVRPKALTQAQHRINKRLKRLQNAEAKACDA